MSMFDWYIPSDPETACPHCGTGLQEWQGKSGPCAMFVWEQGRGHPIDQKIGDDEVRWSEEELSRFKLPDTFIIESFDCPNHKPVVAECACESGVWTKFKINKKI